MTTTDRSIGLPARTIPAASRIISTLWDRLRSERRQEPTESTGQIEGWEEGEEKGAEGGKGAIELP